MALTQAEAVRDEPISRIPARIVAFRDDPGKIDAECSLPSNPNDWKNGITVSAIILTQLAKRHQRAIAAITPFAAGYHLLVRVHRLTIRSPSSTTQ